ncbi:copper-resistant cuproprotein CopI [Vibrio rumoiensis]|uniref:Copper-binding protein n=1 Tax=Vibrio rumoiensis 1S-45 TaxID=1188252 RepID=A0A1E5E155_9VIBR|nr:hypothetical protein [Vibrio rumoiensis]OEF24292.1 copper-binding protein [Vibrio rumoiensis 1S-45]
MKNTFIKTTLALSFAMASSFAIADMSDHKMESGSMEGHSMKMDGMEMGDMEMGDMEMGDMDMSKMDMSGMKGMTDVGMPAKGVKPDKVVQVILADDMTMTFAGNTDIQPNDVVQFVVMNKGKIDHEFTIGSEQEQEKHREMMKNMAGMTHAHDSGSSVTVTPGKAKQMLWHFHGNPNVEFACNIPGHAEAGMVKKMTL